MGEKLLAHVETLLSENGRLYEVDTASAKEPLLLAYSLEQSGQPRVSVWSVVLLELAKAALVSGELRSDSLASITLLHQPSGFDDPYVILPYERFPRAPEAGDTVTDVCLDSAFSGQSSCECACHRWRDSCGSWRASRPKIVMDGGEKVWEAQLGPYLAGDEVSLYVCASERRQAAAISDLQF